MPADVVSDMPGNHRSSRLRRSSHCVTEPARTASFRERPPASGGGCFRLRDCFIKAVRCAEECSSKSGSNRV
ncbi:hypothetical protein A8F35_01160 [Burkholderia cenocepacia]|nr:hypothetical protein A8F35_01160 [Burkholderia cenocepacia]